MIPDTVVIGCGGSGCNMAERLSVLSDVRIITINTDSRSLTRSRSDERILIGNSEGCKGNANLGRSLTKKAKVAIKNSISEASHVILMTGLGGGTGTGSVPVMAKIAKNMGSKVSVVVTLPMTFESERRKMAESQIRKIWKNCDSLVMIDSGRIEQMDPGLSIEKTMKVVNEVVCEAVMRLIMMENEKEASDILSEGPVTVSLAEKTEPSEAVMNCMMNMMFSPSRTADKRMLVHVDGILRKGDTDEIASLVRYGTGHFPTIIANQSSAKKITVMMFIPLSDTF